MSSLPEKLEQAAQKMFVEPENQKVMTVMLHEGAKIALSAALERD